MNPIDQILLDLRTDSFSIEEHAAKRMIQRRVGREDIQELGHSCFGWILQTNGRYKLTGMDLDGDDLTIVCVLENSTVVVTVF